MGGYHFGVPTIRTFVFWVYIGVHLFKETGVAGGILDCSIDQEAQHGWYMVSAGGGAPMCVSIQ